MCRGLKSAYIKYVVCFGAGLAAYYWSIVRTDAFVVFTLALGSVC